MYMKIIDLLSFCLIGSFLFGDGFGPMRLGALLNFLVLHLLPTVLATNAVHIQQLQGIIDLSQYKRGE